VNDEGSEAAAATTILGCVQLRALTQTPPPVVRVDHPFVFTISDHFKICLVGAENGEIWLLLF